MESKYLALIDFIGNHQFLIFALILGYGGMVILNNSEVKYNKKDE